MIVAGLTMHRHGGNLPAHRSQWQAMMERRLVLAKRLLNPSDSRLIVTIDQKAYLAWPSSWCIRDNLGYGVGDDMDDLLAEHRFDGESR